VIPGLLIVNNAKTSRESFIISSIAHVTKFAPEECTEILTIIFVNNVLKVVSYVLPQVIYPVFRAKLASIQM